MTKFLRLVSLVVLVAALLPLVPSVHAQDNPGVSDERFARLARGINLTNQFWQGPGNPAWAEDVYDEDDFTFLHDMGFTYIRLPIDVNFLLLKSDPDLLSDAALDVFDKVLQNMLDHQLAVVVEIHGTDPYNPTNPYSGKLEKDPAFIDTFDAFWASFAAHLSTTDPESVFLEVLNEPVYQQDTAQWPPIQERLVATVRANAPEHTIIVTGAFWSNINTLIALEPFDDPNIIYNFHFYESHTFTHQGITSASPLVAPIHDVPYPSSPEAVAPVIEQLSGELADDNRDAVLNEVRTYGEERWDINRIDERIQQAVDWSESHGGLRLMCNEFGVYNFASAAEDRAQWLYDVRTTFEKYNISWALWNYKGQGFNLVHSEGKTLVADVLMVEALGLQIPQQ